MKRSNIYFPEIDLVKTIAIISVILLHTIPSLFLYRIYAPFHIWQAIPLFMLLAGITSTLSVERFGKIGISYLKKSSLKYMRRIIFPFTLVWLVEIFIIILFGEISLLDIFYSYFAGGIGPGSYFTPLFIQHILFFPILYYFIIKIKKINVYFQLIFFFFVSLLIDWLTFRMGVSDGLYRLLYVRYLFAVVLGIYIWKYKNSISKKAFVIPCILSICYIYLIAYLNWIPPFHHPSWIFQHAPCYFYTVFLVFLLWKIPIIYRVLSEKINLKISNTFHLILIIGKASYHIYLAQMVYFWLLHPIVIGVITNMDISGIIKAIIYLLSSLTISLFSGIVFYRVHMRFSNWNICPGGKEC